MYRSVDQVEQVLALVVDKGSYEEVELSLHNPFVATVVKLGYINLASASFAFVNLVPSSVVAG